MLGQRAAFAAFPRLKLPAREQMRGLLMLSRLVVKRAKFDAQVVSPRSQLEVFSQLAQACLRLFAEPLPKLIRS